jgi:hypothetical protein
MMTRHKAESAMLAGDEPFLIVVETETHSGSFIPSHHLQQVIAEITPAEILEASTQDTFQIQYQWRSSTFDLTITGVM